MISDLFEVAGTSNTPEKYLTVGYEETVVEVEAETILMTGKKKMVRLEYGDILVGTVKQQVALFAGEFEAYAQQGWKVLRIMQDVETNPLEAFIYMNTPGFQNKMHNAYQGESVSNLSILEFMKFNIRWHAQGDKLVQVYFDHLHLQKRLEKRIELLKTLKKGFTQKMFV